MENSLNELNQILLSGITIWVLLGGAFLGLIIDAIWPKKLTLLVYTVGIISLCVALFLAFDQWKDPHVFSSFTYLKIDLMTLFFLILVVIVGIITLFNALGYIKIHQTLTAEFCALILFSIIGMIFLVASNHLFVSFIGLETMSLSIYILVGSHKKNSKSGEAAIKYFITGSVASAILLYGIAIFYGSFGTLDLSILSQQAVAPNLVFLRKIAVSLLLVGVLFKLAIVPFHFWAPDVYEGAPAPVTGFMATGVKIAAFGFALRILTSLEILDSSLLNTEQVYLLLKTLMIATLILGNLLALIQESIKRMLAYSSISHAGFALFGILASYAQGTFDPQSTYTVLFYLTGYLFMTLGAFAFLSLLIKENSEADQFTDLRGLGHKHPFLAGIFTLFMLSLIGIPGTVGFAGKYNIIALAVQNNHISLALLAVIMSVISVFYYLKPSVLMYFKENDTTQSIIQEIPLTISVSLTICGFLVVYFGLCPDMLITLTKAAAKALM
ncbi:MAG: NADH-quinone oxidoreductase subunit N [bacterium]|nr:NADH-quinone oxidoreductase subunit N [bacterium]